jgi:hypothetical protein
VIAQRVAGALLALTVAAVAAGCVGSPAGTPSTSSSSAASSSATAGVAATGTPPATIAPDATYVLPLVDGAVPPDPALRAKSAAEIVRPGAVLTLTTPLLVLMRESVEGTMVASVVDLDGRGRALVARVVRFDVVHKVTGGGRPATLTLPKGTLVRIALPDERRREKPIPVTDLVPGRVVALRIRIGLEPVGTVIRLLSVDGEGGV